MRDIGYHDEAPAVAKSPSGRPHLVPANRLCPVERAVRRLDQARWCLAVLWRRGHAQADREPGSLIKELGALHDAAKRIR